MAQVTSRVETQLLGVLVVCRSTCVFAWLVGTLVMVVGTVALCLSVPRFNNTESLPIKSESGRSASTLATSVAHKQLSEQGSDIGLLSRSQYLLCHDNTSHQHTGDNVGKLLIVEKEKYEESGALCCQKRQKRHRKFTHKPPIKTSAHQASNGLEEMAFLHDSTPPNLLRALKQTHMLGGGCWAMDCRHAGLCTVSIQKHLHKLRS